MNEWDSLRSDFGRQGWRLKRAKENTVLFAQGDTMKRGWLALFTTLILGLVAPHAVRQGRSMRSITQHKHDPRSSASSHDARLLEYRSLPLGFEANQGQTAEEVKFLARGNGYSL